jgi:hypothetical protein
MSVPSAKSLHCELTASLQVRFLWLLDHVKVFSESEHGRRIKMILYLLLLLLLHHSQELLFALLG